MGEPLIDQVGIYILDADHNAVRMPDGVWTRLNWSWAAFFTFMGAANLLVAYNFPTDTWVNFKLFGGMGLMFVFVVLQALFLARHVEEKEGSP